MDQIFIFSSLEYIKSNLNESLNKNDKENILLFVYILNDFNTFYCLGNKNHLWNLFKSHGFNFILDIIICFFNYEKKNSILFEKSSIDRNIYLYLLKRINYIAGFD